MKRLLVLWVATIAVPCWAVPQMINYQGYLAETDGTPLDTVVSIAFTLYDAGVDGTPLWTEMQPSCTVRTGHFSVKLGSVTALIDPFHDVEVWLGVRVGGNSEMMPRTRIVSVPYSYRVGTVDGASGGTISDKLNVGQNNTNTGHLAMVAGQNNSATGWCSIVAGGENNTVTGVFSAVSGGQNNVVSGALATIGGGISNSVSSLEYGFVGGGCQNVVNTNGSVCTGGILNTEDGYGGTNTIGGGTQNALLDLANSATIGGGYHNLITRNWGFIGGGANNHIYGDCSVIAGGGGWQDADSNFISGASSVIGGGKANSIAGELATIGGGFSNRADSSYGVIGGGYSNVTGRYATVPGGYGNHADGEFSFAAGRYARADYAGDFALADATDQEFGVDTTNRFGARFDNGYRLYTDGALSSGVFMFHGDSDWSSICDSTKKRNIRPVDTKDILARVARMPVQRWSFKSQDPCIEHIGPMAQDFWNAFHVGQSDTTIGTIDPVGVALAAIQELAKRCEHLEQQNIILQQRIESLLIKDVRTQPMREE